MTALSNVFFSIVVPAYNTAPYFPRCLDSLLSQSFGDLELIIVDDGSTDGTGHIADKYAAADDRVQVIHTENSGVSKARNVGICQATGEYILFVDSDDTLVPGALERIHQELSGGYDALKWGIRNRSSIGAGKTVRAGTFERRVYETTADVADACIRGELGFISACTTAYRLRTIRKNGIAFREEVSFGEDQRFNWDFLQCCGSIAFIPDQLYIYTDNRAESGSNRYIPGILYIFLALSDGYTRVILQLCRNVSETEKRTFEERHRAKALRDGWDHLGGNYSSLTRQQKKQELMSFLKADLSAIGKPKRPSRWLRALKTAIHFRSVAVLKLMMVYQQFKIGKMRIK